MNHPPALTPQPRTAPPRRVLVLGAEGFIGRQVAAALHVAGHEVSCGIRPGHRTARRGGVTVDCDFSVDTTIEAWLPRLAGIDAVVNCVGILRERPSSRFRTIHVDAPLALFRACERLGIRRVIQVSALGNPADGEFIASKHRADDALAALELDWTVLRPSVVYSTRGSYGGTSLLRALAAMPLVLALPGAGRQPLDVVSADDLGALVVRLLAPGAPTRQVLEIVGPETLTLEQYLLAWRQWLRVPAPRFTLRIPTALVRIVAAVGERLGSGPLGRTMNAMLDRGNVGGPQARAAMTEALGRPPVSLRQALAEQPSFVQDRWQARLHLLDPALRLSLAFVWVFSAWVGFGTSPDDVASLLAQAGVGREAAIPLVYGASAIDLLLGLLLGMKWRPRLVGGLMIASVLAYTAFIGMLLPASWWDPFGGLLKNLILVPAIGIMIAMADRK